MDSALAYYQDLLGAVPQQIFPISETKASPKARALARNGTRSMSRSPSWPCPPMR
ncbi:hypothetical protein [Ruegeria jejuensis]|uniref:hypothetical protein n=1 Tax=Ruegeria jejuensis TaxID=3233338 RepID=UPI00355C5114